MTAAAIIMRTGVLQRAWVGLLILWVINTLKNVDRVLMGVLAPSVKSEFQLSDSQVGLLALGFAVSYAIFGLPFGRMADKYSRRVLISAVVAAWSFMTAMCGIAANFWALLAGRIGIAVGEAGYLPAAITMISDYFSPRMRNLAIALLFTGSAIGVFAGLALGGWLASEYGWRTAFLALGLPGLAIAMIAAFILRDPARGQSDTLHYAGKGEQNWRAALAALMRNRLYVWITLTSACNSFAHLGMVQWLPSFFQRSHAMSLATLGISFGTAFALGMLVGHLAGGTLSLRLARGGVFEPLKICIFANLAVAPCCLLALWLDSAFAALCMTMVATFLAALAHPAQQTAEQNALQPQLRGMGHATKALVVSAVAGLVPFAIGLLSDALAPALASDSLRWALSASQIVLLFAALAGWRAYVVGHGWEQSEMVDASAKAAH